MGSSAQGYNAVTPYLFFNGQCDEALDFYKKTLGAEIEMLMRFKDAPDQPPPEMKVNPDHVMHCSFRVRGTHLMASDGCADSDVKMGGFSLTITVPDEAEAKRLFEGLSQDAQQIVMPLGKTFFSPCYGALVDQFGLGWMVMVPGEM